MIHYENILYCTDFSEEANMAFYHALDLAKKYEAKLYIFHVLHSPFQLRRDQVDEYVSHDQIQPVSEEILVKAQEDLERTYGSKIEGFDHYECFVRAGVPFVEIIRFAKEKKVDMIVMGAMGRSEIDRQTFGSTVENVARRAHCHVVAIRNPEDSFRLPG